MQRAQPGGHYDDDDEDEEAATLPGVFKGGTGTFTNIARGAEAPSNVNDDAISTAIRTFRDDEAMAAAIREFMRDIPTPEGAVMSNITLKTLPEKYNSILKH